jgi:colanic acid/amylovoran biosynthesis protein
MRLENVRIELTADPAFCLRPDVEKVEAIWRLYRIPKGKTIVGFAPSQAIAYYSGISYDDHFKALQNLMRFLITKMNCHVILIPHVRYDAVKEDDRVICEQLYRSLGFPEEVTVLSLTYSSEELRGIIGKLDLMIAERMHAAIAGLSQNVPVFVVGYSVKGEGILGDIFGFDSVRDYIVSVRETDADVLNKRISNLLDKRSEISKHLSNAIPRVKESARRNFSLIMETLG